MKRYILQVVIPFLILIPFWGQCFCDDKVVNTSATTICVGGSVTVTIVASELGAVYQLRNNADNSNVGSSVAGTGGNINLSTGALNGSIVLNILSSNTSVPCSSILTSLITVTVNANPTVSPSATATTVCSGKSTTLSANATAGSGTISSYAWSNTLGSGATANASPTSNTTYTVTVTNSNTCTVTGNIAISVNTNPTVSPSATSTSICNGKSTTLSANATPGSGTISSYAWSNSLGSGSTATASPTANTTYSVTVTNTNTCTVTGNIAISVNANPTVSPSATSTAICNGQSTTLSANAAAGSGTISSYAWNNSLGVGSTATASPGANTTYSVTVTNSNTCTVTGNISIVVNANPTVAPTASPVSICTGTSTTLSANATAGSGTISSYAWSNSLGSGTSATAFPTNTTISNVTTTYTVTVINSNTCSASGSVNVTVNPKPSINNDSIAICSQTPFKVIPLNPNDGTVPPGTLYTWATPATTGNITGGSNGNNVVDSIIGSLKNLEIVPRVAIYTVTPKSSGALGSCAGTPFTLKVQVNPKPSILPKAASICGGSPFTINPQNAQNGDTVPAGTTYTWSAPSDTISGATANAITPPTSITQTLMNTVNTPVTVVYSVTPKSGAAGACPGSAFPITVTVNPKPVINNITDTICSGDTVNITPQNLVNGIVPSGTKYSWIIEGSGFTPGNQPTTNQNAIRQKLDNTTNQVVTATYKVVAVSGAPGACVGDTFRVTVKVNPTPEIGPKALIICGGQSFSLTPSNGGAQNDIVPAGTAYSWSVVPNSITPTGTVFGGVNGANDTILGTLDNQKEFIGSITYSVIPTSQPTCQGAPFNVVVSVNPTPMAPDITLPAICSGETFNYAPVNTLPNIRIPVNTVFVWGLPSIQSPNSITGASANQAQTATGINQTLINDRTTNTIDTAIYTVTPLVVATGCTGSEFRVHVPVNPKPHTLAGTDTVCSSTTAIELKNSVTDDNSINYTWKVTDANNVTGASACQNCPGPIAQPLVLAAPPSGIDSVIYSITSNAHGCPGDTITRTVVVYALPEVPGILLPYGNTACSNTNGFVAIDTIQHEQSVHYWWSTVPVLNMSGQDHANASFDLSTGPVNVIKLTVEDLNHCKNSSQVSVQVSSTNAPTGQIVLSESGNEHTLIVLNNTASSYQWGADVEPDLQPVPAGGETQQDYNIPQWAPDSNHYWVIVRDGECMNKIYYNRSQTVVATSVVDITDDSKLVVYPNPVSDKLNILVSATTAGSYRAKIYSYTGQLMMDMSLGANGTVSVPVATYAAGFYLVRIERGYELVHTAKFIKQ